MSLHGRTSVTSCLPTYYYADFHHHDHLISLYTSTATSLSLSLWQLTYLAIIKLIMDLFKRTSTPESERMVKIELEAAEALAGLARFPTLSNGSESVAKRVKDESNDCNSSFNANTSCEETTNSTVKKPEKSGIITAKWGKDEQSTKLRLNPSYPTNRASSGRRSRQNLTEAEIEARKIRRVLANRESARQTIRRRQAVFEELTRKAVDLAWENENLKREKENASKQYDSLKTKNECLKAHMTKGINSEAEEAREESITTNEPTNSTSSTNSPFIIYNQPSFLPFVWPSPVQLQCGSAAGIVFPSHIPVDSSSCEGSSGTPLYLFPYPWLVTLPQNENNENRPHSFNLNDIPRESSECQQLFPEKSAETPTSNGHPPDGCSRQPTDSVSCEEPLIQHDTYTFLKRLKAPTDKQGVGELNKIHQVPVVCSGKRSGDTAAASEARKRRKELTRLKNHFNCRQLLMH